MKGIPWVITYDDNCPFCQKSVLLLCWLDWLDRLRFCTLNEKLRALAPQVDSLLLFQEEATKLSKIYSQGRAIRKLAQLLPIGWLALPLLHLIPLTLLNSLYSALAKRRQLLSTQNSCALKHNKKWAHKLISIKEFSSKEI